MNLEDVRGVVAVAEQGLRVLQLMTWGSPNRR